MQEIYIENLKEVIRGKARLQKELKVKITNKGKNVFVNGTADNEFLAMQVLEAVKAGFSVDNALKLTENENILQIVHIKDITNRNDLDRVRGRIIGSSGRTLATLKKLTNCDISLQDNEIGLIGDAEGMDDSVQAVTSLVQGSKQGNVYARLERETKKKRSKKEMNIKNELG